MSASFAVTSAKQSSPGRSSVVAANDEFPRGWTFSVASSGGTASITLAPIIGVIHVLDNLTAKLISTGGAAFSVTVTVTTIAGVIWEGVLAVQAGVNQSDEVSGLDLGLASSVGDSVTGGKIVITFTGGGAGFFESLNVEGHDI